MAFTKPFSQIGKADAAIAGGKGASLGEMTQAGIPVPPGFVILSAAFERFLRETELHTQIDAILHEVKHQDMASVETAAAEIKALILNVGMPQDIVAEIREAHQMLGAKFVAVRSSATAEDSASAAWAGQLDSYLNTTAEQLIERVQHCWASLFTPRAIFYRFEKNLHEQHISVAVVVQEMVASDVSGVAFSVHPVTEDHNQLIIEAGYGLGEAIVSGQITPDSYVVEKDSRKCIEKNVSAQEKKLVRAENSGNVWQEIPPSEGSRQKLSDSEVLELTQMIIRIEQHYAFPVDIEWARANGRFFITQSRPITTLKTNAPISAKKGGFPIAKYSLEDSTWTYKGFHSVLHTFFPVGQVGFTMKPFFKDCCTITLFCVENDYVHWYWNDPDLTRLRETFFKRLQKDPKYLKRLQQQWSRKLATFDRHIARAQKIDFAKLSNEALCALYDAFYAAYLQEFSQFMVLGDAISMHADRYLVPEFQNVLGKDFGVVFQKLLTTKHVSFIEQEDHDRQQLITAAKKNKLTDRMLERHAVKYFYIKNNYAKAAYLTAADFRALVMDDLKNQVKVSRQKKQNLAPLLRKYRLTKWHKLLLYVMDEFFGIQDTRKKYVLISNYYQFRFLREAARRTGIPFELVTYSVYPEFRELLTGHFDVQKLKERKECCACIRTSNGYEIPTGESAREILSYFQQRNSAGGELKGISASRGKAQGTVKIILKIHDMANMEQGDILVTSMTRPEMVPAMKLAAAIVTDEGGVTSHAAIISRELGIPCIIGTKIATQVLKDGDLVEVDANTGTVRKL